MHRYDFRQAPHALVDLPAPSGAWKFAPSAWDSLPPFPSEATRTRHAAGSTRTGSSLLRMAYDHDFATHSTNLVAKLNPSRRPATPPAWPSLGCA